MDFICFNMEFGVLVKCCFHSVEMRYGQHEKWCCEYACLHKYMLIGSTHIMGTPWGHVRLVVASTQQIHAPQYTEHDAGLLG